MNAVVMDGADIGSRALVAANAFIPAGLVVPADHLAAGNPGKVIKELDADALAWKANGIRVYQELARRSLATLVPAEALHEVEPDRPSLSTTTATSVPLHEVPPPQRLIRPPRSSRASPAARTVEARARSRTRSRTKK